MQDIDPHEVEYHKRLNGLLNSDHRRMGKSQPDPVVPPHALADAIAILPLATFQVALAIHGDQTGEGVKALVRFLRQGDVLLVDDPLGSITK